MLSILETLSCQKNIHKTSMSNKLYIFLGIVFISLTLYLGSWGITESSEARYAQIGKEMFISGDYINPTLLGIKHLHKPPVAYYFTALGYSIFGINEFGARFFMQLALVFQLFFVFKIALLLYKNEKIAFASSLIYFTFPIVIIAVRSLTTDTYLTTFILGSIYFWLNYKKTSKKYFLYLFYLFLGLIFETKGPVGFIIPVTFITTHKIINKEKIETSIHQLLGFLLFILVSASWFIAVVYSNEGLLDYFINTQLIDRISKNNFKRGKPFWYYLILVPTMAFPWAICILFYFKKHLKNIISEKKNDFTLLITFVILFMVLSFSTSKLILYMLPLFFIIAIFSAKYIYEVSPKIIEIISIIILSLIGIAAIGILASSFLDFGVKTNLISTSIISVVFSIVSIILFNKIKSSNFLKPAYLGVTLMIVLISCGNIIFGKNEHIVNSVKPMVKFIEEQALENKSILVYNYLLPTLPFYLDKDVVTISHGKYTTHRETQFERKTDWKKNNINYFDKIDRSRLQNISEKDVVVIKRKKATLPDTLYVLTSKLKHKKEFGKYTIYY